MRNWVEPLEERRLLSAPSGAVLPLHAEKHEMTPLVLVGPIGAPEYNDVATFTGGNTNWLQASTLPVATINWGDGTSQPNARVYATDANTLGVVSLVAHYYTKPGSYKIDVTLEQNGQLVGHSVARLRVARISPGGRFLSASAKQPFHGVIGTFSSTTPPLSTGYTTTIDWGDGMWTQSGTAALGIKQIGPDTYRVTGTHTYAKSARYLIIVSTANIVPPGSTVAVFAKTDIVSRITVS